MKKTTLVFFSFILLLMVFACSWEVPEAIRITGDVGIENFTLNYNASKEIAKKLNKGFDFDDEDEPYVVNVLMCPEAPEVYTYIVHMDIKLQDVELPKITFDIEEALEGLFDDLETDIDDDMSPGGIDTIIDNLFDQLEIKLDFDNTIEWEGVDTTPSPDWSNKLRGDTKQKAKDAYDAGKTPEQISQVIQESITGSIKETIYEMEIIIADGGGLNTIEPKETIVFTKLKLPDFLDLDNLELDDDDELGFKAKLYISVFEKEDEDENEEIEKKLPENPSRILDNIDIFLEGNNEDGSNHKEFFNFEPIDSKESGIKQYISEEEYPEIKLPGEEPYGRNFVFEELASVLFAKKDNIDPEIGELKIKLKLKKNIITVEELLHDFEIFAEIVMWLPLSLKIKNPLNEGGNCYEYNGSKYYKFAIPLNDDDDDFFDRDSPDDSSYANHIKGLTMNLQFNKPVYPDTLLIIHSNTGNFTKELRDTITGGMTLNFDFNLDDLEKINSEAYYPFIPKISLLVDPGGLLQIKKGLILNKFTLITNIDYNKVF